MYDDERIKDNLRAMELTIKVLDAMSSKESTVRTEHLEERITKTFNTVYELVYGSSDED